MKSRQLAVPSSILALGLVASCSSGGGSGGGGMTIVSCSLQCTDQGGSSTQISCGLTNVFVNQEITITFSQPVNPTTVNSNTVQMIEQGTGKTPAGAFLINPQNDRQLIYRPQLTFDSAGAPIFGLVEDKTYFFRVPGAALDPLGPYIRSTTGSPNANRLLCTLVASQGVFDPKPGAPRAFITVDKVTGYDPDGDPSDFAFNVAASEATNVWRASPVRMVFDDVMNPATLANPVSGTSNFIRAFVDADGNTANRSDQVPLGGTFALTVDQNALRTTVIFTPSGGFPSTGLDGRKIVIELSPQIVDLGGNRLLNAGTIAFTPELIQFEPFVVEEPFANPGREDQVRSGVPWGQGQLAIGRGGGSGRLGDLVVLPGQVVVLDTDSEDFSELINPQAFNPVNVIDRPADLMVTDGVFEFSRLRVDAGGILRFTGTNPARLYVRGECVIQGVIDVSGASGVLHSSSRLLGGDGGTPGPGGGAGGSGGDRPDGSNFVAAGGIPNPGVGPSDVLDPSTYLFVNGEQGGGIAFPSTIDPSPSFVAGGVGGLGWPQPTSATPTLHMPQTPEDVSGIELDIYQECRYLVQSPPGSGGAHALSGKGGDLIFSGIESEFQTLPQIPPDTPGGDVDELQLGPDERSLSPELGLLRGGTGGGGGGAHLQRTRVNGVGLFPGSCDVTFPTGSTKMVIEYLAHSSAGGGGGGGGLQIAAGRRLLLNGRIDASGGDGGSGTFPPSPQMPDDLAQAGGGGAGGAVLLQADTLQIQGVPNRIDVSGGEGGEGSGSAVPVLPSLGGRGAPGLLRMEASIAPVVDNEQAKITPLESTLKMQFGASVTMEDVLSVAEWHPPAEGASGWSGAQSCWIQPTDLASNYFELNFEPDAPGAPGWDMRLRIDGQATPQSFRGANDLFPGQTLQEVFGSDFGDAPIIVRFQAARAVATLIDPCSVPETGVGSPIALGSQTDWVRHPSELDDFHSSGALTPNMFRFVVLWDRSQPELADVEGIEDLMISILPD
jgi:hypothetical protein